TPRRPARAAPRSPSRRRSCAPPPVPPSGCGPSCSSLGLLVVVQQPLHVALQPVEALRPVLLEAAGPLVDGAQPARVQRVEPLLAGTSVAHEADLAQHLEVLGGARLGHAEPLRDGGRGQLTVPQQLQDVPPPLLRHRVEDVGGRRCSCHASNIYPYGKVTQTAVVRTQRATAPRQQAAGRTRCVTSASTPSRSTKARPSGASTAPTLTRAASSGRLPSSTPTRTATTTSNGASPSASARSSSATSRWSTPPPWRTATAWARGERSTATTSQPRRTSSRASAPVPLPISSTRRPGRSGSASATARSRGESPVIASPAAPRRRRTRRRSRRCGRRSSGAGRTHRP